tara:strand:+ start:1320 stop:1487 length:168 start_codon:yes stop_codon:yes gene_type:complete
LNPSFIGGGLIGLTIGSLANEALNDWKRKNSTMYFGIAGAAVVLALWSAGKYAPN